ncbi:MAG: hypothetical protein B6244_08270 [Candidatus Cloacimonetes bacterium 4572_55]|nr:MAG: hypothetical protein B6244_08270 [Candidatus Cloacimonetes bacterium 4572_55]
MLKKMVLILMMLSIWTRIGNAQELYINEFLASNTACFPDENGEYDDWIEIYNADDQPVNIGGMYITDDLSDAIAWQIPDTDPNATTIPARGFLILWADKESEQGPLHVEIKLSGDGEQIGLFADDTTPIDTLTFGSQTTDISYGRLTDGGEEWGFFGYPSPGEGNENGELGIEEEEVTERIGFFLRQNYPNPMADRKQPGTAIGFYLPRAAKIDLSVYNATGQKVESLWKGWRPAGEGTVQWLPSEHHANGIYYYTLRYEEKLHTKRMLLLR